MADQERLTTNKHGKKIVFGIIVFEYNFLIIFSYAGFIILLLDIYWYFALLIPLIALIKWYLKLSYIKTFLSVAFIALASICLIIPLLRISN